MFLTNPVFQQDQPNPDNKLALFGGINSQSADIPQFRAAWKMAEEGKPREVIWKETGWFQGPDGNWRYEIDDSGVKAKFGNGPVGGLITHPQLQNTYPGLLNIPAEIKKHGLLDYHEPIGSLDASGMRIGADNEEEASGVALHELQHAIQNQEGFNPGAWPKGYIPGGLIPQESYNAYVRSPGEAEARAVQQRMNLTPSQRKEIPPWLNWDYWK